MKQRKGRTLEEMMELNAKGLTEIAEFKAAQEKHKQHHIDPNCLFCQAELKKKLN